jgi:hypothetical protein
MDRNPGKQESSQASDAELDQFLSGDSPVSKAYRKLGDEEPPAKLDRAILDAARDHVKPAGQRWLDIDLRFWRHWSRPITTIVIVGFCLSVVLQIMQTAPVAPIEFNGNGSVNTWPDATGPAPPEASTTQQPASARNQMRSKAEGSLEEITVTARKRLETRRELPLAATALPTAPPDKVLAEADGSPVLDEVGAEARHVLADDALEAWEQGARPTGEVWLAGINSLRAQGELEKAGIELDRLTLVYPEAGAAGASREPTGFTAARDEPVSGGAAADLDSAGAPYPSPDVWLAGIDWLERQEREEEAAVERKKFARIYPGYLEQKTLAPRP